MIGEVNIKISTDMMNVSACIKEGQNEITVDYVLGKLEFAGVNIGILRENVEELVSRETYDLWFAVAEGKEPGESISGHYEYFVDMTQNAVQTTIDENGNVNYGTNRTMVTEGTKLAEYHHAVSGTFGYTVFASVIAPTPVNDHMIQCGEGVKKLDDFYYASVDGEVVLTEKSISVNNILVIEGNAKYGIDSNTEFVGDVHIKGDVLKGVSIIADGSVEIDGTVEASAVIAGKDIVIHGGVQGDGEAVLKAGGTITCPFVESASLTAEENIQVDYVMNSSMVAGNNITIYGRRGTIIGGCAIAKNELTVGEVGNDVGVVTSLAIENSDLQNVEYSKVVIQRKVHENVKLTINGTKCRLAIRPRQEYHLSSCGVVCCDIGKYVPMVRYEPEEKVEKKTILLVDDEPMILKTFYGFLSEEYKVLLANSAKDARAQLEQRAKIPDLILLDYKMPVMDGAEFLQSIRKTTWKDYTNVPVIFVTAVSDKEIIKKCLTLYPQGYLIKPLGKEDLLQAVHKYFSTIG